MEKTIHHYFVDEAGDLSFFDRRGRIIVGQPGVSHVFMVGVAHIPDPKTAHQALERLRHNLLNDPYFQNVPSMRLEEKKTAIAFHAKDDLPEVRREMFALLPSLGVKIQVAIRRKKEIAQNALVSFQKLGQKMDPNALYDDLVKRLFKNLLHKADENHIVFAMRGKSPRQLALRNALLKAKNNFQKQWNIVNENPFLVDSGYPHQFAGLQIIDYYLWALQRFYERNEDRFFRLLAQDYRLIMDLDDTRAKPYGQWYSDKNPLELKKIKPVIG